jgi:hypothetical protein
MEPGREQSRDFHRGRIIAIAGADSDGHGPAFGRRRDHQPQRLARRRRDVRFVQADTNRRRAVGEERELDAFKKDASTWDGPGRTDR